MEEDKSLLVAWLDTSMNLTGKTFWDKVANNFRDRSNGSSNKRPQGSLQCRYGEIQKAVNKFIGTLTKVQNSKHSGLDELDKVSLSSFIEVLTCFYNCVLLCMHISV